METWEIVARESVRHTISAYNYAGDRGRIDELAACFVEDGTLEIGGGERLVGRDAIVARLQGVIRGGAAPTHVHHHVSGTHFVAVDRERIEASGYFVVFTDVGADHWGRYHDVFVPSGDRWLFRSRRALTKGYAPDSFFREP